MTVASVGNTQHSEPHWTTDDFAVVVCAGDDSFAIRLGSALAALRIGCKSVPAPAECHAVLEMAPAAVLVIKFDECRAVEIVDLLWLLGRRLPAVRTIVVARRGAEAFEPLVRELGAVAWFEIPHDVRPVVEIIRRRQHELPQPRRDRMDELWARLPWPEAGQSEANP